MGQIVRRRKKGRPAKSDLAVRRRRRIDDGDRPPRRSLRRRNVRYNFDIDDYVDDEEFYDDVDDDDDDEDDEDARRREKKLRLLLKLDGGNESESTRRRVSHAPSTTTFSPSSSSSDYRDEDDDDDDDGDDNKPSTKKRKVSADDEIDGDDEDNDERNEVRGRKVQARGADSIPGTPSDLPTGFPLPDKKSLELILDKLQKKDIYGVYAEPVDPEELPDYHDVIKNPMDFATIRNKLANGVYSTLEQFESDVFLICTNAMQYNAPDTVYYKQASSIQEMAKGKFQRIRLNAERSEVELKSEQKTASNLLLPKKQPKKLVNRTVQEPVGSDFTSGATLATAEEVLNGPCAVQATSVRPNTVDGLIAENSMLMENNVDKGEELQPGKGGCLKHGRKPVTNDENRRASYNISIQPVEPQESIFSTFEDESKLLVPVGLHADHSYARSLARFAATLGSVAWKVASQRIEQALPEGFKFGRGWVGEYEPLPTPVLMLEQCTLKDPSFITKLQYSTDIRDKEKSCTKAVPGKEIHESGHHLEGKIALFGMTHNQLSSKNESPRGASLDVRPPFFSSPRAKPDEFFSPRNQQQNPLSKNLVEPEKKVLRQVELNYPPPSNKSTTDFVAERQNSNGSDMRPASGSAEIVSRSRNLLPSASFKQSSNNTTGFVAERQNSNGSDLHPASMSAEIVSRSRNLLPSGSFKQSSNNTTNFVAERQNSNGSDPHPASMSAEIVSRSRNLLPSGTFQQSSNNTTDFVAERQNSNGSDMRLASMSSEIVSRSRNLLQSVSFKQSSNNTTDFGAERQNSNGSDTRPASVSSETVSRSRNLLPSVSFKQSSNNGFIPGGLVNGNPMMNTVDSIRTVTSSSSTSNLSPINNSNKKFPVQQDQGLSDPVQLMKMLAEKAQNQHKSSIGSPVNSHTQPVVPQVPSPRREDLNNAALSASHSWMSLGASGVKAKPPTAENSGSHKHQVTPDPSYERHSRFRGESPVPGMHFQPQDKQSSYPVHPFVPQPVRMMTNEAHIFQTRPMVFPQLVTADLSRFQMMQSPWGGISGPQMQQQQLRPKQESRPPDLNIGFQSLGSPVRQSPNVLVDSQQPDLALQL